MENPPTPESVIPQPSSSPVGPSLAHIYSSSPSNPPAEPATSSSPSGPSSACIMASTPATEYETPRGKRNISNRFWEKNDSRSSNRGPGVDLASDTSDPEDDENSDAGRARQLRNLDSRIKRLLALEAGPVRATTVSTNDTVKAYDSLLSAFAHKPRTKKKRAKATDALLTFLQDHAQILDLYNAFSKLDKQVRKDRVLPEFTVEDDADDDAAASKPAQNTKEASDVRHAPAKHALNDDESDEDGIVTQTLKPSDDFGEESVFNTRGLGVPSIFNGKSSATKEKNQRRFLLHRRDGPLGGPLGEAVEERKRALEMDGTPTRAGKRTRMN